MNCSSLRSWKKEITATLHPDPHQVNCENKMTFWENVHSWHGHSHVQDSKASDLGNVKVSPGRFHENWQSLPKIKEQPTCVKISDHSILLSYGFHLILLPYRDLQPRLANLFFLCWTWTWWVHRHCSRRIHQKEHSPAGPRLSAYVSFIASFPYFQVHSTQDKAVYEDGCLNLFAKHR